MSDTFVTLVRHAMAEVRPDMPAERWELGPDGRAAARALAIPAGAYLLTSDEPKARQTAEELRAVHGRTLRADPRVAEARRPHAWDSGYRAFARRYVAGELHRGWEPHEAVTRRFGAAVRDALRAAGDAPLVVVSHGLAITLWLAKVGAVDDPPAFWAGLGLPAVVSVPWMHARRAEERDVAAICRICAEGWRETYRNALSPAEIEATIARFYQPERVTAELAETDEWGGYRVVEHAGRVVAAAGGGLTAPGVGELFVLYVDAAARGQGAGTAALDAVTAQQIAQGAREQWVSVQPENALAIAFYAARGFVRRGERPAHELPGRMSLCYARTLDIRTHVRVR